MTVVVTGYLALHDGRLVGLTGWIHMRQIVGGQVRWDFCNGQGRNGRDTRLTKMHTRHVKLPNMRGTI